MRVSASLATALTHPSFPFSESSLFKTSAAFLYFQTSLESNRKLQIFWTNGKSTAVKDSLSDSHG